MNLYINASEKNYSGVTRREFLKKILAVKGGLLLSTSGVSKLRAGQRGGRRDIYSSVIVGGGISGLTAAYLLKDENIIVLEKEPRIGGRIITGQWNGFHYPKGMEYIGEPEGEMAQWFDELGIEPIKIPPPTSAVLYGSKTYSGKNLFGFLTTKKAKNDYERLVKELYRFSEKGINEETLFESPERLKKFIELDKLSVEQWMNSKSIDRLVQLLVDVENRGLFGASNGDLSFLFNIPEMSYNLPEPYDPEEYTGHEENGDMYTFRKGMIEVVYALKKRLSGKIKNGIEVNGVSLNPDETLTVAFKERGAPVRIQTKSVILTTPAPVTGAIVKNGFSKSVRHALASINYSTYVTLNLFTRGRFFNRAWSSGCMDDFFVTLYDSIRTQARKNYSRFGIIGCYIAPKSAGDKSLLRLGDREIFEKTIKDLEKYEPAIRKIILGHDIHRFRYGFPVFSPGYYSILDTLYSDKTANGPLFLAGDYMAYPTFDGAVVSALRAHEKLEEYFG